MGSIWKSLSGMAVSIAQAATPKEEPPEKPLQIMIVTEPERSKRRQFHDMINQGRDTDGVVKTKAHLDSVTRGTAFDTNCESSFCIHGLSAHKSRGRSSRRKSNQNPWEIKL